MNATIARRPSVGALLAVLALAALPLPAAAHARLQGAVPAPGAAVPAPPDAVRLTFSEPVEPALSGIILADAAGRRVATGTPALDPKDGTVLVVPVVGRLGPGPCRVAWHAVADDGHKTSGGFGFTVEPKP